MESLVLPTDRGVVRKLSRRAAAVIAIALCATGAAACDRGAADKAKAAPEPTSPGAPGAEVPRVRFARVIARPLAPGLESSGTLAADETKLLEDWLASGGW